MPDAAVDARIAAVRESAAASRLNSRTRRNGDTAAASADDSEVKVTAYTNQCLLSADNL
jgi:hypothetical protein